MEEIKEFIVYLTMKCNYSCKMCTQGGLKPIKEISLEDWDKIFKDIKQFANDATLIFLGGEPLVHPNFDEIVELAQKNYLHKHVVTNGSLVIDHLQHMKKNYCGITFSVDGIGETHDKIRKAPGAYDKVLKAIKYMYEKNKSIEILTEKYFYCVNFCLLPENIDEVEDFVKEMLQYDPVDITLNHIRYADFATRYAIDKQMSEIFPEVKQEQHLMMRNNIVFDKDYLYKMNEIVNRVKALSPKVKEYPDLTDQERIDYYDESKVSDVKADLICPYPFNTPTIFPDGSVVSCLYNVLGNALETPISELWNNEIANRTRNYLLENKKFIACSRCTCRYKV